MASRINAELAATDKASPVFFQFSRKVNTALDKVFGRVQDLSKGSVTQFSKMSKSLTGIALAIGGLGTSIAVFKKIGDGVAAATKTVLDFEKAMIRIQTLNKDGLDIDRVRDRLQSMGSEFGNTTALANGLFEALTRGASEAEAFDILEASAMAAIGQFGDLNETVSLVNQVMRAYGDEVGSAIDVTDGLIAITQTGNAVFKDLVPAMGQVIGIAADAGVSFQDAGNAIASLAIVTGDAARAATGFRNIIQQARKRSDEFAAAGINVNKTLSGQDGFLELMRQVKERVEAGDIALGDLFTNIRAVSGAGIAASDIFALMEQNLGKVNNASGQTVRNFKLVSETLGQSAKNAVNALTSAISRLAGTDFPQITQFFQDLREAFDGLSTSNIGTLLDDIGMGIGELLKAVAQIAPFALDAFGVFTEAVRLALKPLNGLTVAVAALLKGIGFFIPSASDAADGLLRFSASLDETLSSTVGLTAALSVTAEEFSKNLEEGDKAGRVAKRTAEIYEELGIKVSSTGEKVSKSTEKVAGGFKQVAVAAEEVKTTVADLEQEFDTTAQKAKDIADATGETVQALNDFADGTLIASEDGTRNFQKMADNWIEITDKMTDTARKTNKEINEAFSKFFGNTPKQFAQVGEDAIKAFKIMSDSGRVAPQVIAESFEKELDKVKQNLGPDAPIVKEMEKMLKELQDKADKAGSNLNDSFKKFFGETPKQMERTGKNVIKEFKAMQKEGSVTAKELFKRFKTEVDKLEKLLGPNNDVVKEMKKFMDELEKEANDASKNIKDAFKGLFGDTEENIQRESRKILDNIQTLRDNGVSITADMIDKMESEYDRLVGIFGPNHPFVREFRSTMEGLGGVAGDAAREVREAFKGLGSGSDSELVKIGGAVQDVISEFNKFRARGRESSEEVRKAAQIAADKIAELGGKIPQKWLSSYGVIDKRSTESKDTQVSNFEAVGQEGTRVAELLQNGFQFSMESIRNSLTGMSGTWLEQLQQLEDQGIRVAGSISDRFSDPDMIGGSGGNQSSLDRLGSGTTQTGNDFGQRQDSQFNQEFGSGELVGGVGSGREALLNELALLDSQLAETRGNAWIERRRAVIAELRKLDEQAKAQQEEFQRQQEQARNEFIAGASGPNVQGQAGFGVIPEQIKDATERVEMFKQLQGKSAAEAQRLSLELKGHQSLLQTMREGFGENLGIQQLQTLGRERTVEQERLLQQLLKDEQQVLLEIKLLTEDISTAQASRNQAIQNTLDAERQLKDLKQGSRGPSVQDGLRAASQEADKFKRLQQEAFKNSSMLRDRAAEINQELSRNRSQQANLTTLGLGQVEIEQRKKELVQEGNKLQEELTKINERLNTSEAQRLSFAQQTLAAERQIREEKEKASRFGPQGNQLFFDSFTPASSSGAFSNGPGGGGAGGLSSGGGSSDLGTQLEESKRATESNTDALLSIGGGGFTRITGQNRRERLEGPLGGVFGISGAGDGLTIGTGLDGIFDVGGLVPETGAFMLKKGERVLTQGQFEALLQRVSNFENRSRSTGGTLSVQGTGMTGIRQTSNGSGFTPQQSMTDEIQRLASRGNLRDKMGNTAQRELAKAILPAQQRSARLRLTQSETQRNTAITNFGEATTK